MDKQQLKIDIMKRVETVHTLRRISSPLVVDLLIFCLTFVLLNFFVSVPSVIINLWNLPSVGEISSYIIQAFVHTRLIVQLVLSLAVVAMLFMVWDFLKNIGNFSRRNFAR